MLAKAALNAEELALETSDEDDEAFGSAPIPNRQHSLDEQVTTP